MWNSEADVDGLRFTPRKPFPKLHHTADSLSAIALLCIQAQLPSSVEAGSGRISSTGLQRLLWISCFLKLCHLLGQLTWLGLGSKENTCRPVLFCRVDSPACLDSCMLWIPRTAQSHYHIFWFFLPPQTLSVELKHAVVLWVRDERHDFYSFRSRLGTNSQKQ